MPGFLGLLTEQDIAVIATGLGTLIASIFVAIRGAKKGKPTTAAVAGAISAASCRAGDLADTLSRVVIELDRLHQEADYRERDAQARHREMLTYLVQLEDRTRQK